MFKQIWPSPAQLKLISKEEKGVFRLDEPNIVEKLYYPSPSCYSACLKILNSAVQPLTVKKQLKPCFFIFAVKKQLKPLMEHVLIV